VAQKVISVKKCSDDYHAHLGDDFTIWGCGRSPSEAIGKLISAHPEACGIEVVYTPAQRENDGSGPLGRFRLWDEKHP